MFLYYKIKVFDLGWNKDNSQDSLQQEVSHIPVTLFALQRD